MSGLTIEHPPLFKAACEAAEAIERTASTLAAAVQHEMILEDLRAIEKTAAIQRLMQTTNPETQKVHSASSAEKVVELDAAYAELRGKQRTAAAATITARAAYEAQKRRADLALLLAQVAMETTS